MSDLILILLLNSLIIVGIHVNSYPEGVFYFLHKPKLVQWIKKPFIDCVSCMASIHSTYVYWLFMDWNFINLAHYPLYVIALSGLNLVIYNITTLK